MPGHSYGHVQHWKTPSFFSSFGAALGYFFPFFINEGHIHVFKNMLSAKFLPLQTRLQAWEMSEWTRQGLLRPGHWGDPPRIGRQEVDQNPVHTRASATVLRCATSPLVVPAASLQQVLALGCVVSWWRGKQKYMFVKLVLFPLFPFSHWVSWVLYFSWALLSSLYNAVTRGSECPCSYSRVNNWCPNCMF